MFADVRKAGAIHNTSKRKATEANARILKKTRAPINKDSIQRQLLKTHFMRAGKPQKIYTTPRSALRPQSLDSTLMKPATKCLKVDTTGNDSVDGLLPELDEELPVYGEFVSFQLASTNLGFKKTVPVSIGAGGKLDRDCLAITIHRHTHVDILSLQVDSRPTASDGNTDVVQGRPRFDQFGFTKVMTSSRFDSIDLILRTCTFAVTCTHIHLHMCEYTYIFHIHIHVHLHIHILITWPFTPP